MPGLEITGFEPATLEDIRAEINESLKAAFGPSIDVSDGSVLGQLAGIMAERFATLWELAEAVNASQDPDAATGARLDAICALTGTQRLAASASTVTLHLTGTNGTAIPVGSKASVTGTEEEFETIESAVLATATSWVNTTAYTVGQIRTNASRIYIVTTAGTSAGSGGPTTTASAITDGTVVWRYVGEGAAYDTAAAQASETGPTIAVSGAIITIETPVGGWSSVMNLLDADLGSDQETDEALRIRREAELAASGTSTADAIRADLLALPDVTAVTVFVNDTDLTDADGVPPHAVEALVQCPDNADMDQLVWDQLLASVAAGIATYGDESGTSEDDAGNSHTMKFSRPEELTVYVDVTLIKDPDTYPADGDDQVKAAIVAYGDTQACGKDVVASRIAAAVFAVTGVLDVTDIDIGLTASPTLGTTIAVTTRQLAVYDTSRVTVATSDGTP